MIRYKPYSHYFFSYNHYSFEMPVHNKAGSFIFWVFILLLQGKLSLMDLRMYLKNELVDSAKINPTQLNKPGYVDFLRSEMKEKNEDIIDLSDEEPQFFIETIPSSMNTSRSLLQMIN